MTACVKTHIIAIYTQVAPFFLAIIKYTPQPDLHLKSFLLTSSLES